LSSYPGKVPNPKRQIPRNQAEKAEVLKAETGTNPFTGGNEGNGEFPGGTNLKPETGDLKLET
jgi:hypothetical protein